jgi:hypothetical protein
MSGTLKTLLLGLAGGFFGLFAALIALSQYSDYRAASETTTWLVEVEPTLEAIAAAAKARGTIEGSGTGVALPTFQSPPLEYARVTSDGTVIMRGGREGQLLVLVPSLAEGEVAWRCVGGSRTSVAIRCRNPPRGN